MFFLAFTFAIIANKRIGPYTMGKLNPAWKSYSISQQEGFLIDNLNEFCDYYGLIIQDFKIEYAIDTCTHLHGVIKVPLYMNHNTIIDIQLWADTWFRKLRMTRSNTHPLYLEEITDDCIWSLYYSKQQNYFLNI